LGPPCDGPFFCTISPRQDLAFAAVEKERRVMCKLLVAAAAALFWMTALPAHSTDNGIHLSASADAVDLLSARLTWTIL
jgi:hypothetical protein